MDMIDHNFTWLQGAFKNVNYYLSTSVIFPTSLHLLDPCKHALCQEHGHLHAFTCLQLHTDLSFSLRYWLPPSTRQQTCRLVQQTNAETRRKCKEWFHLCFSLISFNLLYLHFLHTYIYPHIQTQSIFRKTQHTQQKTTWERSGFTLLEELEPLRVETEENYKMNM